MYNFQGVTLYNPLNLPFSSVSSDSLEKLLNNNFKKNELKSKYLVFFYSLHENQESYKKHLKMFIKYYSRHETVGNDNFNQDYSYIIYFLVCNYFCFVFYNFISARTLINTLLLTHSRTKPAVPWLHTVGSTTNNRGNLFLKVHSVQKRRGCVLAQVSLIFLVRPSSHSSIAHLFILERFVPILVQVLLI